MTDYQILKLLYKIKAEDNTSKKALAKLIEGVGQNIRDAKSGKGYKADISKFASSIILSAIKRREISSVHGSWIATNGKQYVTDGARLLEINQPIDLAKVENSTIDYVKLVTDLKSGDLFEVNIPSIQELEIEIKLLRAQKSKKQRIIFGFGEGLPAVNAEYLLGALKGIGQVSTIHMNVLNPCIKPLYIENELGTLFLLPVANPTNNSGYWIA